MTNHRSAVIRGKVARFTRLNGCGVPVSNTKGTLATDGYVKITITQQWQEGVDTAVKNANGKLDVTDKTKDQLKRVEVVMEFTRIDPEAISLVDGNPTILNAKGDSVGFGMGSNATDVYFGLETWQDITNTACGTAKPYFHYTVPYLGNGKIDGEVVIQEETASFTMKAESYAPNSWGASPYLVDLNASDAAAGLFTPIDPNEHVRGQRTLVAPPAPTAGLVPLVVTP
ncbi:hypothetical protein OG579_17070 [Williamsia herbipolensis]|uniref:Major tail protein n=1 Tax=Williamsia herbipolensis TaxID=1603258 RepID=A0AAU4K033_9NOCA|nr:hypothetical protein [Williamsia herbipolensis]